MARFKLPLSGDVDQVFNPWNWTNRSIGGQFGFINIDMGQSGDPDLERRILDDVGSYGRQIGQLADALQAVLLQLGKVQWQGESKQAIDAFHAQWLQVKRLKDKARAG